MELQNNCSHAYEDEVTGDMLCDISEMRCRFIIPKSNCNLNKPQKENIKRRKEKFI